MSENMASCHTCFRYMSRDHPITHEVKGQPNPHPLGKVTASPVTGESKSERNSSSVSNRDHWQPPKDIFDWQDIKNWALGVELEKDPRADRHQPTERKTLYYRRHK